MAALEDLPTSSRTRLFLTRHLQRIDDTGSINKENDIKWNTKDRRNPQFLMNPYLSDQAENNVDTVIRKLPASEIDIIITSPFLRCIQTSVLLKDAINKLKPDDKQIKQIHVNFNLSEIIDDLISGFEKVTDDGMLNIDEIYQFSLSNLDPSIRELLIVDNHVATIETEVELSGDDSKYKKRIINVLNEIFQNYRGYNILVVTHADSNRALDGPNLKYTDVIEVSPTKILQSSSIEAKYLKYKKKYI